MMLASSIRWKCRRIFSTALSDQFCWLWNSGPIVLSDVLFCRIWWLNSIVLISIIELLQVFLVHDRKCSGEELTKGAVEGMILWSALPCEMPHAVKQIQLDHNVGVVLCTGCTGVSQRPSSGLSDDKLCGTPGIPVKVLSVMKIRVSVWRAAKPEQVGGTALNFKNYW